MVNKASTTSYHVTLRQVLINRMSLFDNNEALEGCLGIYSIRAGQLDWIISIGLVEQFHLVK